MIGPALRNQSLPIERRTCKHLRSLRGEEAERERLDYLSPPTQASTTKDVNTVPKLLLAQSWDNETDLTDWWMSEKLDGVRAWWDGQKFLSRQGNIYHAPAWFTAGLPNLPLDGELWLDRKAFQRTVSTVRRHDRGPRQFRHQRRGNGGLHRGEWRGQVHHHQGVDGNSGPQQRAG